MITPHLGSSVKKRINRESRGMLDTLSPPSFVGVLFLAGRWGTSPGLHQLLSELDFHKADYKAECFLCYEMKRSKTSSLRFLTRKTLSDERLGVGVDNLAKAVRSTSRGMSLSTLSFSAISKTTPLQSAKRKENKEEGTTKQQHTRI